MNSARTNAENPIASALITAGVLLAGTLAQRALAALPLRDASRVAVLAPALGILAMTLVLRRRTSVPAWSLFASAGVLASAMVAATLASRAPAPQTAWLFSWFLLMTPVLSPRRADECARASRTGYGYLGIALVLAAALLGISSA